MSKFKEGDLIIVTVPDGSFRPMVYYVREVNSHGYILSGDISASFPFFKTAVVVETMCSLYSQAFRIDHE